MFSRNTLTKVTAILIWFFSIFNYFVCFADLTAEGRLSWALITGAALLVFTVVAFIGVIPENARETFSTIAFTLFIYSTCFMSGQMTYQPIVAMFELSILSVYLVPRLTTTAMIVSNLCLLIMSIFAPEITFKYYTNKLDLLLIVIMQNFLLFWKNEVSFRISKNVEALEKKVKEAEVASEAKGRFLANMSHEIRTPMNAIQGMTELILNANPVEDFNEIIDNAQQIKHASQNLLYIVNDILDLAKIEKGKVDIIAEPFGVLSCIYDINEQINIRVRNKPIKFIKNINGDLPGVLVGDEVKIRQILLNLLTNAVKFTNDGAVSLTVDFRRTSMGVNLLIYVDDTGIGFRKEDMNKIFENFSQFDIAKNKNTGGTGLGLSIVKGFMDLMGGTINIKSEYGEGTRFSLCIPLREPTNKMTEVKKTRDMKKFKAPKAQILCVDDNVVNLKVSSGLLKQFGINADICESGAEAVALVKIKDYDMVFMDHMMPEMDGIEATKIIRDMKEEKYQALPIIALTANAIAGAKEMFLANKMTDFVSKPIHIEEFWEILNRYLPDSVKEFEKREAAELQPAVEPMETLLIRDVDIKKGILNCGGEYQDFLDILRQVYETGKRKIVEIEEHYKSGDNARYTIEVHALKSVAYSIGADKLAFMASQHEKAGKDGNQLYIRENLGELLAKYNALITEIRDALSITDSVEEKFGEAPIEKLGGEMELALQHIEDYDLESVSSIARELMQYKLSPRIKDGLVELLDHCEAFNYKEAAACVKAMQASLSSSGGAEDD